MNSMMKTFFSIIFFIYFLEISSINVNAVSVSESVQDDLDWINFKQRFSEN